MQSDFSSLPPAERIIVALDCSLDKALSLADTLAGKVSWVKVGMTLYYEQGPFIVQELKRRGFKVFLDLKFHDIPHQVEGAARSAAASGADMLTMHAAGGIAMMQAALSGAAAGAAAAGERKAPVSLGITVLTSTDQAGLESVGVSRELGQQVEALAQLSQAAGLSGVVASPWEAARLREILGPSAYIVTPGVRPAGAEKGDQSRIATPAQAFEAGASHIVIGRPITCAASPLEAYDAIVSSL